MTDPDVTVPPPDPPDPPMRRHSSTTPPLAQAVGGADAGPLSPSPNNSSSSTPPWVVWSRGLNPLLEDPKGESLFKTYLLDEGCYLQLTFLYAYEGLKYTDPQKIPDLVKKIYGAFIPNLIGLTDSTKSELAQAILDERYSEVQIFGRAVEEVLSHMKENLYPNFLKSELYIAACNSEEPANSSGGSGSGRDRKHSEESAASVEEEESADVKTHSPPQGAIHPFTSAGDPEGSSTTFVGDVQQLVMSNQLETVHEDKELSSLKNSQLMTHQMKLKKHIGLSGLTKEALLATENLRATEFQSKSRKPESTFGSFFPKQPIAGQAVPFPYHASYASYNPVSRVDSEIQSMSSDAMTDDGNPESRRHHERRHHNRPHQSQCLRMDPSGQHHSHRHCQPSIPKGAAIINVDEVMNRPIEGNVLNKIHSGPNAEKDFSEFANLLANKLKIVLAKRTAGKSKDILAQAISKITTQEEESPNDIIDSHFGRVPYFADVTPKSKSPKLRSPTIGRRRGPLPPVPPPSFPPPYNRRQKEFSSSRISVDSGNVPDSESFHGILPHSSNSEPSSSKIPVIPKSFSVPHELRAQGKQPTMPSGGIPRGYHHQPRGSLGKPGMFKNSSMEFDSGISVVSSAMSAQAVDSQYNQSTSSAANAQVPDKRAHQVHAWLAQSTSGRMVQSQSLGCPSSQRRKRVPNQPELDDADFREKLVQAIGPHAAPTTAPPRHSPPSDGSSSANIHTIVIYDDNDEMPYSLRIPRVPGKVGSGVTLGALKERLPRHGSFRYYFRTVCPEVGAAFVLEEILNDSQELPTLNGKIFAHLKTKPGN